MQNKAKKNNFGNGNFGAVHDNRINVSSILNFFQFVLKYDTCDIAVRSCFKQTRANEEKNLIELNAKTYATPL
jgi:hypothetical protein